MKIICNKKFSVILLLFSIALLVYIFFKSEVINDGLRRFYYNQYYYLSISFIIISFFSFYLKRNVQNNLLLFFISTIAALYLFEFITIKKYIFTKYESRDRYQFFNDAKKKDYEIKLTIDPHHYILRNDNNIFPLSGISNKKTVHCNESDYYSIYDSDIHGFNNPSKIWKKKKIDFLLVGDSFLHGACVNRPKDIASLLRKKYNYSSLNLGYSGNGPLTELATLTEYLPYIKVKNIIWVYFEGNDLSDLIYELKSPILKNYLGNTNFKQGLFHNQNKVDEINENFFKKSLSIEKKNKIIKFIKLHNLRSLAQPIKFFKGKVVTIQPKPPTEFLQILKQAQDISNENKTNLYFLFIPDYFRYSKLKTNDDDYKKKEIIEILNKLNIRFLDFHEDIMSKEKDPLIYYPLRKNNHFNEDGYALIAKYIFDKIK
jgi:lysophospholipase L1-like esterase